MHDKRTVERRVTPVSPFLDSFAELERLLAGARELRARATADMLAAAGRAVSRSARTLRGGIAPLRLRLGEALRARRQWRRVRRELMAYGDRELDEINIRRSDIQGIARGRAVAPASE